MNTFLAIVKHLQFMHSIQRYVESKIIFFVYISLFLLISQFLFAVSYFFYEFYCCVFLECIDDEEENGPYQGKFIGSLNSFHHQVSGKVYAVDEYTFLLSGFNYDGNGADTFFWAGASNRPGPQGFILPDEYGQYVKT